MSRRFVAHLSVLCLALVPSACGGEDEGDGGDDVAAGTAVLELSDGTVYDLTLDETGCTTVDASSVTFTAAGDGVEVAAEAAGGSGNLLVSGDFEAEGRIDTATVGDGVATLTGVVTEADDSATPNDFTLTAGCA